MTYKEAKKMLDGKKRGTPDTLKVARNTYVERGFEFTPNAKINAKGFAEDYPLNAIGIRFHETYVAIMTPHWTELYSGGWHTVSTRDRMEMANVRLAGDKAGWNVCFLTKDKPWGDWDAATPYFDGIRVRADGTALVKNQPHRPKSFVSVKTISGFTGRDLGPGAGRKAHEPYFTIPRVQTQIQGTTTVLDRETIRRCPFVIFVAEHYRADGTCKCDDAEHRAMMIREWEYTPDQFEGIPLRAAD